MKTTPIARAFALAAGLAALAAAAPAALAGEVAPTGELTVFSQPAPMASTKTREERKAETLAANRNGGLGSLGTQTYRTYNNTLRDAIARSTKTRAEGKAETMQAIRQGHMVHAGEA
jgi:hypothetical protein